MILTLRARLRRAGPLTLAAVFVWAPPAQAQQPEPDAAATMRWGPLSVRSTLSLSNVGVDNNVFNRPEDTRLPGDFTLVFTPTTNLWVRMGRTWLDGVLQVDWVYFNKYASERGTNSRYRLGAQRTFNRLKLDGNVQRISERDRPNYEIDARSQRFDNVFAGEIGYRAFGKTWLAAKATHRTSRFDKDAIFLGTQLAVELDRRLISQSMVVRHELTPLTTVALEIGSEKDRFFTSIRDADSTRVLTTVTLQPSALISGTATVGYRNFVPSNQEVPPFRGLTALVNLTYRLMGTTRVGAGIQRDVQHSFDARQPYYLQTGTTWSVQQQVYGPFDVLARTSGTNMAYRDRIGAVVQVSNRVDHVRTYGAGAGFRLGNDKRVGFLLDHVKRTSGLEQRRFSGLRYGVSVTYER